MQLKGCEPLGYGRYDTLQDAIKACDSDSRCWGFFDSNCDEDLTSSYDICLFGSRTFDLNNKTGCSYFKKGSFKACIYIQISI